MGFAASGKKNDQNQDKQTPHIVLQKLAKGKKKEMTKIKTNKHLTLSYKNWTREKKRNDPNQDKQTPHTPTKTGQGEKKRND